MSAIPPSSASVIREWPVLPPSPLEEDMVQLTEKPEPKLKDGGINYVW